MLAGCYYNKKDYANAMKYYLSSAKQGFAPAFSAVGALYYDGYGVPTDYKKAYTWVYAYTLFEKTAEDDLWNVPMYMYKINGKGFIWDSEPLISLSDLEEARTEGRRMYEETKKRNGWE
ncbi:MAG: sel1 repeat family protein [Synergistaceae bacterium]|nr:sel1 repeat family protein [Synergistaceae bacterium]